MRVLVLQTSIRGERSASRTMVDAYLSELKRRHPEAEINLRDFATSPLPHISGELAAIQLGLQKPSLATSAVADELIEELENADVVVIGLAMYNFTVPSTLKTWLDHVIRVQRTFRYEATGPLGLLPAGKKVVALVASGGVYSAGPAQQMDFLTGYLTFVLGFIGITDVSFVRAEAQASAQHGPVSLEHAIKRSAEFAA